MQRHGALLAKAGIGVNPVVPENLRYNTDLTSTMAATRNLIRCTPTTGNTANPGDIIRFEFPNDGILDFSSSALIFKVVTTSTGGTFRRLAQFADVVFKKIRVTWGSTQVLDVNDYNLIASYQKYTYTGAENFTIAGPILQGIGTTTQRNTAAAGQVYYATLTLDFFNKPIPVCVTKDKLLVELTLDQATNVVECDGTVPVFAVSQIEWDVDQYTIQDSYKQQLMSNPIYLRFRNCELTRQTVSGTATDYQLSSKNTCLTDIIAFMRRQSTLSDPTVNDKFITYNYNATNNYQVRHSGHYHPPQPVDCTGLGQGAFFQFLRSTNAWSFFNGAGLNVGFSNITFAGWDTTQFVMCVGMETFPHSSDISGKDSVDSTENIIFNLQLASSPANAQELDFLLFSEYILCVHPSGVKLYF